MRADAQIAKLYMQPQDGWLHPKREAPLPLAHRNFNEVKRT